MMLMKGWLVVFSEILLLFSFPIFSQSLNPIGQEEKPKLKSKQIWFSVIDDATGMPVKGAKVSLGLVEHNSELGPDGEWYYGDLSGIGSRITDANGLAKFWVSPNEYVYFVFPKEPYADVFFPRNQVTVGGPKGNVQIPVRLKKEAKIVGTFTDVHNRPLMDYVNHKARVSLYYLHDADFITDGVEIITKVIEDNGNFTIPNLWPGKYRIRYSCLGIPFPRKDIEIEIKDYGEVLRTDYIFDLSKAIEIIVLSKKTNKPLEEVAIGVVDKKDDLLCAGRTDANGRALLYGIDAGEKTIKLTHVGIADDEDAEMDIGNYMSSSEIQLSVTPGGKYTLYLLEKEH